MREQISKLCVKDVYKRQVHTHGRGGSDTMYATFDDLNTISKATLKTGVTSFLPTTMTMPVDDIAKAIENIAVNKDKVEGAQVLGTHLEGPFFNKKYKGAQPEECMILPTVDNYLSFVQDHQDIIRKISIAPELEHSLELISYLKDVYKRQAKGCTSVKRTTGQHPGGIIVIPENMDVFDFTPYQYPADDLSAEWKTTHFDFHAIHDNVLKFDILGHVDPTVIRMLQDLTGVNPKDIPTNDPKVMSLFNSTEALGIDLSYLNCKTGALGLPEFGTKFVRGMLEQTHPTSFSDLVILSGLRCV